MTELTLKRYRHLAVRSALNAEVIISGVSSALVAIKSEAITFTCTVFRAILASEKDLWVILF